MSDPERSALIASLTVVLCLITSSAFAQPDIECPPDSIPEGEPVCYEDYVDTYNPGCNGNPPAFQLIECNTTICGTSGVYDFFDGESAIKMRDMDWFTFTAEFEVDLDWWLVAEYPVAIWLFDAGSDKLSHTCR